MIPTSELKIGRHEVAFFGTNLVRIIWCGDVSDEDAQRVRDFYLPASLQRRSVWVTDLSRLGKMTFRARMILSGRDVAAPSDRHVDLIFAAANLRTKIVMSIITSAASFASGERIAMHFVDTVEEGMRAASAMDR